MTDQPLAGKRVLVTRPPYQAGSFSDKLRALGAEPVEFPTIGIAPAEDTGPLDEAIAEIKSYNWVIFTSTNAVAPFWKRLKAAGKDARALHNARLGAIGPKTAAKLETIGLLADFMPDTYVAEAIVDQIGDVRGQRILLPRSHIARAALVEGLEAKGADVDEVTAYRTVAGDPSDEAWQRLHAGQIDVATFTASSTVRNFIEMLDGDDVGPILDTATVACIGPITAGTAREHGIRIDIVAEEHTIDGLIEAIIRNR
ncbi:MAG: Uroporphyrinogen-III synthase [Anaerolineales bacterium]|nr:Uroporphyrinogen-III synthase [Anaerolineales bacterium]